MTKRNPTYTLNSIHGGGWTYSRNEAAADLRAARRNGRVIRSGRVYTLETGDTIRT